MSIETGYYWVRLIGSEWFEPAFYRSDCHLFFIVGEFDGINPDEFEVGDKLEQPEIKTPLYKNTGGE